VESTKNTDAAHVGDGAAPDETDAEILMREAVGKSCCARHAALGADCGGLRAITPLDGPCGPVTAEDLGTMSEVAFEGLHDTSPDLYARGALRAVLVLCATLAPMLEVRA